MIDNNQGPDLDRLPPLPMPQFEAVTTEAKNHVSWVKKAQDGELSFRSAGQIKEMELKPLYQVMDERFSVYWQKAHKG